jgi:glycosyltransferase involved in cell wall biosynthesis
VRRFGTVFPFAERGGGASLTIGRLVANHDFIRALLLHSSFDEFVFSSPSTANLKTFAALIDEWNLPSPRRERVRLVPMPLLGPVLAHDRFEVMHLGGWGYFMPGLHALRRRYAPVPWPITGIIHSLHGREMTDHAVRMAHARLLPCDAIFCTSRDGREALARLLAAGAALTGRHFEGGLLDLPLGIDDTLLDVPGDRQRARARLRIADDAVVLLVLGRLSPAQKTDLGPLVRAFAREMLPVSNVPLVLVFAGSGSQSDVTLLRDTLERFGVLDHTRINANFKGDQKADLLAMADVLVAPTDNTQETFGLSLLEALGNRVPVVASRFDGYKDLVEDGIDGFLVDALGCPADPVDEWFELLDSNVAQLFQSQGIAVDLVQLVDRVLRLVHDPHLRSAMGEAGRRKVDQRYRWSRIIAMAEGFWHDRAELAAALAWPPREAVEPWSLSTQRVFRHYPTRTLSPTDRVRATVSAPDERPYNEVAPLLGVQLLEEVLRSAATETTLGALVNGLNVPSAHGWFIVTWLLKYGFLRIER